MKLQSVLFACMLTVTGSVLAATTFTYQGQLQDGDGPFDGTVDLTISLFDAETGGSAIGTPINLNNIAVSDGLFQVELDFGQVFDGGPKWIEIEVGGVTLAPRQRVTSVPVAQYAHSGPSAGSVWQLNGSDVWYTDGNVGIGTDSPSTDLVVRGSVTVGNNNNQAIATNSFAGGSGSTASGIESFIAGGWGNKAGGRGAFVGGGSDNVADGQFSFAAGRRAEAQHNGSFVWASGPLSPFASTDENQFLVRALGGVGINTNEPETPLHVMGDTTIGGFAEDYRLGVGTSSPWATLHVVSNDQQGPLRVMVDNNNTSSTAIRAYPHQGVAIGHSWTDSGVPERGLRVNGMVRIDGELHMNGTWSSTQAPYKICADYGASFGTGWYYLYPCSNGESSSRRYKEDIQPLESALSLVESMRAVSFRWKENGMEDIGLIAEDVAEIEPRLVFENKGEIEGINYSHLTAVLVRAMQERRETVDTELAAVREAHKVEMKARDAEIAALRRELDEQRRAYDERLAALEDLLLAGSQVAEHSNTGSK